MLSETRDHLLRVVLVPLKATILVEIFEFQLWEVVTSLQTKGRIYEVAVTLLPMISLAVPLRI